jgi:hypothetical protein
MIIIMEGYYPPSYKSGENKTNQNRKKKNAKDDHIKTSLNYTNYTNYTKTSINYKKYIVSKKKKL